MPDQVEGAVQACLTSLPDDLTADQVDLVLRALSAYGAQGLTSTHPGYTQKMLTAAQRAWYLLPAQRKAIEQVVLWNVFDPCRPNDVEIIPLKDHSKKNIFANSLVLTTLSDHFKAMFESTMREGTDLRSAWTERSVLPETPLIRLQIQLSAVALKVLLGRAKSPKPTMQLLGDLRYLQPTQKSAARELSDRILVGQLMSKLSADTVWDLYNEAMAYDPINEYPDLNYLKDCCARLLMEGIDSVEQWDKITEHLDPKDLLERGMQRHLDILHHQDLPDETLFKVLSGLEPNESSLSPEVAADILIMRLPDHLKQLGPISDKPVAPDITIASQKKLKFWKRIVPKRSESPLAPPPPPLDPSKVWLDRFEAAVPQISHYNRLNIQELNSYQLTWLLDRISPYAKELNLSGFMEPSDACLWARSYPVLEQLTLANCPYLREFSGKKRELPSLRSIDFSESPRLSAIASGSGLQLSRLDVHGCPNWNDLLTLITQEKQLQWVNAIGCGDEFVRAVRQVAAREPSLAMIST